MANISDWLVVLHIRPYRDSSLILETFSKQFGRLPVVAQGVRTQNRRGDRAGLQMSALLDATLSGRSEMRRLIQFDVLRAPGNFVGEGFAMATYVSELILRTTQSWNPMPEVFTCLLQAFETLKNLSSEPLSRRKALRELEWVLIQSLGTAVDFDCDHQGEPISPERHYRLRPEYGFMVTENADPMAGEPYFSGDTLIQLASGHWHSEALLATVKKINQILLAPYLGGQPLKSRELWLQWKKRQ
jgi:DNA repair protein RecO (recombination protein O)